MSFLSSLVSPGSAFSPPSAPFARSDWPFPPALPVTCRAMPLAVKEERTRGIAAACCLLSSSQHDSPLLSALHGTRGKQRLVSATLLELFLRGCGNRALPNHYKHSGHSHMNKRRTKFRYFYDILKFCDIWERLRDSRNLRRSVFVA